MSPFVERVVIGLVCAGLEWVIIRQFGMEGGVIAIAAGLGFFGK